MQVLKWTAAFGVVLGLLGAMAIWLAIQHYEAELPQIPDLKGNYQPPQVTRVLARDGTLLAEIFTERRTVISIASLPPHVKLAVLAAEDASFYEHEGLDYWGMVRAMVVNLRSGRTRQGGSTITQQVVKNILLDPERSFRRKVREALLAVKLEQNLSKDEILELYLNHIYFGHGRYGIEEAARYYFGKSARDLSLGEAALLAGIVPNPEAYSPRHDLGKATARRSFVLGQMLDKSFIDQHQHDEAMAESVHLAAAVEAQPQLAPEAVEMVKRVLREAVGEGAKGGGYTITTTIDPVVQAAARKAIRDNLDNYDKRYHLLAPFSPPVAKVSKNGKPKPARKLGPWERPFEGTPRFSDHKIMVGVVIGSDDAAGTLDLQVGTVRGTVRLADYERYNPNHLPPSEFAPDGTFLRVSLLAPPPSAPAPPAGAPAAAASGSAPAASASAASAPSAAPAAIAPQAAEAKLPLRLEMGPQAALVALDVRTREVLALVGGYDAVTGGLDRATQAHRQPGSSFKPIVYSYALDSRRFTPASMLDTNPGSLAGYRPSNFEDSEGKAPMRLREALALSVNVAAVHVLEQVGPANVVSWAQTLGISSKLGADLSLALGSYEVTPMEMAAAYATFASGGLYERPVIVSKIVGPDGREVALPPEPPPRRVMDEAEAYLVTSLLGSVVDHGTGAAAKGVGRPVVGKTGTSNQAKDAWFVGYSTDIVAATWTGYDDARPLGSREAGATAALPGWVAFMKAAHGKRPPTQFPRPPGLTAVLIDPGTGLRAYDGEQDALEELFLPGTEPTETSVPDAGTSSPDAGLVQGTDQENDEEEDPAAPDGGAGAPTNAPPTPPF